MYEIKLDKLPLLIKSAPRPLLFLGAPGIGKSEIVKETAQEIANSLNKEFVDLAEASSEKLRDIIQNPTKYYVYYRLVGTQITPEDIQVPKLNSHFFDSLAPLRLYVLSVPGIEGVLFIDEITNIAREDVLTMFFALIQERQLGNLYIQPSVKIILAGNRAEHSSAARPLPNPLLTRMLVYNVSAPSIESWARYMESKYQGSWDKRVLAYLYAFPQDFIKIPEENEGFEPHPCPRSWTNLALTVYELSKLKDKELLTSTAIAAVGSDVGSKFAVFLTKQPPSLQKILNNPEILGSLELERKVLAIYQLSSNVEKLLKPSNKLKVQKVLEWLLDNDKEMLTLLIIMIPRAQRLKFAKIYFNIVRSLAREIAQLFLQ